MSKTYSTTKHINELANDILKAMQLPANLIECKICKKITSNKAYCDSCRQELNHEDGFYLEQAEVDYEEYLDE